MENMRATARTSGRHCAIYAGMLRIPPAWRMIFLPRRGRLSGNCSIAITGGTAGITLRRSRQELAQTISVEAD